MRMVIGCFALLLFGWTAGAQVDARLFQHPDVSDTHITFTYGDDIWIVGKEGGTASRLSSPAGPETFPRFSPDGGRIAFTGNYDGNADVYVIPSQGGMPVRVTHHGMMDRVLDWSPDGERILYATSMASGKQRWSQIYSISPEGGLPERLPMEHAEFGSLSPDGKRIAFTDRSRVFRTWKRYRGGTAADVWIFDLETFEAENITDNPANDELPMWVGDRVYYLSDRGEELRNNLWVYDLTTRETRQLTHFTDYDVHFPSAGPDEIVFGAGGVLFLLDLETEAFREVKVRVITDQAAVKPRKEGVENYLQNLSLSPDGNRVIAEARGELFTLPAEKGFVKNLSQTPGVAERYPAWSPDGKQVAYWSDKSGEYELMLRNVDGSGEERQLTGYGPGFRYQLFWSPDSKKLAFIDKAMVAYVHDVAAGKTTRVYQDPRLYEWELRNWTADWSPDSRWLVFSGTQENMAHAIYLFDATSGKTTQVTSGFYSDMNPVFDWEGKHLFLATNRSFTPVYGDFDNTWTYPNATHLAVIPLGADAPSPLAAENDTVSVKKSQPDDDYGKKKDKDKKKGKDKDKDGEENGESEKVVKTKIDFDGLERRMVILPVPAGNVGRLAAADGKLLYMRYPPTGTPNAKGTLMFYDIKEREEKTVMKDVNAFQLSADGKKVLVSQNGKFGVIDPAPDQKLEKTLPLGDMEAVIDPRAEWRQIFADAWRFERDYFYDEHMHGVDWDEMRRRYEPLIEHASTRTDVNFILGELIGELNASHTYRGGGDVETPKRRQVGYLGVDWEKVNGHYRVKKVIRGAPWDNEVVSPFDEPGVDVGEGDFILAVNGVALSDYPDPWGAFEGLASKTVELVVNDRADFSGGKKVIVKTLSDETRLRNLDWINRNRERVLAASDGKIGYIYVPSTGVDGQNELVRQFMGQWHMEGLIIDERFNNGGQIPDRFIELLDRKPLAYWDVRDGKNWQWPPMAHFGPKAMLINGWAGSGGDAFPDYFRKAGLGPLIGMRTWGGLIGISGAPTLVDNGSVTVPTFRMYEPDGTWFKEGHGVDPDIEVVEHPTSLARGVDPQLEKAIEHVMEEIRTGGYKPPPSPDPERR